jgi:hypothetical protein
MSATTEILSKETKLAIAEQHVRRFTNLLQAGGPNVNQFECEMYRGIWEKAVIAITAGEALDVEADDELAEYILSGETDLLTPEELKKLEELYPEDDFDIDCSH